MDKRGMELATSTIIMVLVGLIVLVIIVVIFRQQATKGTQGYQQYAEQTNPASLGNCNSMILGRLCVPTGECTPEAGRRRASGFFNDCKESGKVCCETT